MSSSCIYRVRWARFRLLNSNLYQYTFTLHRLALAPLVVHSASEASLSVKESDFVASESTLSRGRFGSIFAETGSDQSSLRASWHFALSVLCITLFSTLSHNRTHYVLERFDLGNSVTNNSNSFEYSSANNSAELE
ncbi:hypothetical protein CR513_16320, partial [Mucuna pruriens]